MRDVPQQILTAPIETLDIVASSPPSPCAASPEAGSRQAATGDSQVSIARSEDPARDRFAWKLRKGDESLLGDFADPVAGSALGVPDLPLMIPVTGQLVVGDDLASECWQTTFTSEPLCASTTKFRTGQQHRRRRSGLPLPGVLHATVFDG